MSDDNDVEYSDIEDGPISGSFCSHWSDPYDCEEECKCGHPCKLHSENDGCDDCDCEVFENTK